MHTYIKVGVRGVPERRMFFLGAFGTGVGCEFPFPSVLLLLLLPTPALGWAFKRAPYRVSNSAPDRAPA